MRGATGNIYAGLHEFVDMMLPLHLLRSGDLFLDVGANIGLFTLFIKQECADATVHAFEPTPELNRFVAEVVGKTPPPAKRGRRLRLYYSAQIQVSPPRVAIQVNDRRLISRDWAYHLENRMREAYGLEGVPLIIDFVPHSGGRGRPQ